MFVLVLPELVPVVDLGPALLHFLDVLSDASACPTPVSSGCTMAPTSTSTLVGFHPVAPRQRRLGRSRTRLFRQVQQLAMYFLTYTRTSPSATSDTAPYSTSSPQRLLPQLPRAASIPCVSGCW